LITAISFCWTSIPEKKNGLRKKAKYYTPDFSPDGTHLIAVSINDSLQTELHLISAANGTVVKRIRSRNGDYFMHPKFIDSAHSW
jgi:Tol biopolymer transport system component